MRKLLLVFITLFFGAVPAFCGIITDNLSVDGSTSAPVGLVVSSFTLTTTPQNGYILTSDSQGKANWQANLPNLLPSANTWSAPQTFVSSATFQDGTFSVGGDTFVVKGGKVGIGATSSMADLYIGGSGKIMVNDGNTLQDRSGDFWMTSNAYYDGSNWQRQNTSKTAFGVDLRGSSDFPSESEQGSALWVAQPGANPIDPTFGAVGGWELGWALTASRNFVVGGKGFELDGNGLSPYGRMIHNNDLSTINTGMLTNLYADFSGRDADAQPSWFIGMVDDGFKIRRLPANATINNGNLTSLMALDASGNLTISGDNFSLGSSTTTLTADNSYLYLNSPDGTTRVHIGAAGVDNRIILTLQNSDGSAKLQIRDSGTNEVANINSDGGAYFAGNVGIGTTPATYKLDVYGLIRSTVGFVCPDGTILTSTAGIGVVYSSANFQDYFADKEAVRVSTTSLQTQITTVQESTFTLASILSTAHTWDGENTFSNSITRAQSITSTATDNTSNLQLLGGGTWNTGAQLVLSGDSAADAGNVEFKIKDSSTFKITERTDAWSTPFLVYANGNTEILGTLSIASIGDLKTRFDAIGVSTATAGQLGGTNEWTGVNTFSNNIIRAKSIRSTVMDDTGDLQLIGGGTDWNTGAQLILSGDSATGNVEFRIKDTAAFIITERTGDWSTPFKVNANGNTEVLGTLKVSGGLHPPNASSLPTTGYTEGALFYNTTDKNLYISSETVTSIYSWKLCTMIIMPQ